MEKQDDERLRAEIGRLVHGDYHVVHGWDTPLVNKLMEIFYTELKKREAEARIDEAKRFGGDTVHPTFCKTRGDQFRECVECLKEQRLAQLSQPTKQKEL